MEGITNEKDRNNKGDHQFENEYYNMKNIKFNSKKATIILQNTNGPCPLLAIANILLLSNNLSITTSSGKIKTEQLLQVIGNLLMKTMDDNKSNLEFANKLEEAMGCLPLMQYGMHFNAIFGGVRLFEKTKEFSVFELLKIPIVHGWIVDQSNKEAFDFISPLSYDTLMEKICLGDFLKEKDPSTLTQTESKEIEMGKIGSRFLQESSSQLTFEGLIQLHQSLKDEELCVFFRNNHFATMIKKNNSLYTLVTDDGYSNKQSIVWEKLVEVEGDTCFVDCDFIPISTNTQDQHFEYSEQTFAKEQNHPQYDEDHDFAKQLQEKEKLKYIKKKEKEDKKYRYERRMIDGKEYLVKIKRDDYEDDDLCIIL